MQRQLQPAVDRYNAIEDDERRDAFREKLGGYVRIYAFMSQIIPYADDSLEMLYSYARFLLPHLPLDRDTERVVISDEVGLQFYRIQKTFSDDIRIKEGDPEGVKSPTDVGTGTSKDVKAPLSEIIQALNDRFGTSFSEEDRIFFEQIREKAARNQQVIDTAKANPLDKFQLGIRQVIADLMIQRLGENDQIVSRYMEDAEFQNTAFPLLAQAIFETVRARNG